MRKHYLSRPKSATTIKRNYKPKEIKNFPSNKKNQNESYENIEENIIFNCSEMKEIAEKIHRANVIKAKENKIKDDEIDILNEEIHKVMLSNYDLQAAIQKELELRREYETEQRRIAKYCNDLTAKFRNMDKTIDDYEQTVKSMKKQNEELADAYDKKIEEIDKENKKIQKRIDDRIELYNHQRNEIYVKSTKVDNLGVEIKRQKDLFNEKNIMNRNKFEELQNKYKEMLKKVNDLQIGIGLKKADGISKVGQFLSPEERKKLQIKEIEKKILSCEEINNELIEEINELNKQYKDMTKSAEKLGTINSFSKTIQSFNKSIRTDFKSMKSKTFFRGK